MRTLILASSLLCLVSCSRRDAKVCEAPDFAADETLEACIHRSAYEFARSDGTNAELAEAAVTQCGSLVRDKADGLLEIAVELAHRRGEEGTSDQYWEAREEYLRLVREEARADALRRVVQAKSGSCEPLKD